MCQSHCLAQSEKHFALLNCGIFKVIVRKDNFRFTVKLLCTHLPDYWWETVCYFAVMWNFQLSPRAEGVISQHSQSACGSSNITDLQETVDWGFVDTYVRIFAYADFSLRFGLFSSTCKHANVILFHNQQQINSRHNQNRERFFLSSKTFNMCPDKCTSPLPLYWRQEASDGILLTLYSRVIFRSTSTSLSHI